MKSSSAAQITFGPVEAQHKLRGETCAKFQQPRWLTDAVAVSVHAVRGTVKRIAHALGISNELDLYPFFDINHPRLLPAYFLPALCQETGSFAVLDALEAQVGRVAFRLPATTGGLLTTELAEATQRFGQMLETCGDALRDGRLDAEERRLVVAAGRSLIAEVCQVIAAAEWIAA